MADYYLYTRWKVASYLSLTARKQIFRVFLEKMRPTPESRVLDIGVTPDTERDESNYFEALYPYKSKVVAVSPEDVASLKNSYNAVQLIRARGECLPFKDNAFDIAFSNAVIEHVGCRDRQKKFLEELIRVSKSCFIVTPNRMFPIEHHTFLPLVHYLPNSIFHGILKVLGMESYASEDNLNPLTVGQFKELFPRDLHVEIVKKGLFLIPSNIIAIVQKP